MPAETPCFRWAVFMSVLGLLTLTSRVVAFIAASVHLALASWEVDTLSPSAVTSCISLIRVLI